MRKTVLCLIICFALIFPFFASAEEYHSDISPAIEILRNQTKLQKHSPTQTTVSFSKEDFQRLLGRGATHLTLLDLPTGGALCLEGVPLEKGQTLALPSADGLSFVPSTEGSFHTVFRFKNSNKTNAAALECVLSFSENSSLSGEDQWIETYRDCMTEIRLLTQEQQKEGWSLRFDHAPENGLLNASDHGTVTYAPRTGYEGTDGFRFQYVHPDGRISEEATVRIRVNAPYQNVFFANLKSSPLHAAAIDFVKYTGYDASMDENGNYVFITDAILPSEEAQTLLYNLIEAQGYWQEVFENEESLQPPLREIFSQVEGIDLEQGEITYAQAAQAVSYLLRSIRNNKPLY